MILLVDTNILLDVVQRRPGFYRDSARVWNLAELKVVDAYVSAISFNNVFYILRRQVDSATALEAVKLVRAIFKFVPLDEHVLDRAIQTASADLEDAIQAASASRIGAGATVTRNLSDFARMAVATMAPDELLAVLKK